MKKISILLLTTMLIVAIGTTAIAVIKNKMASDEWDPTISGY